jgi:hypothetical protein
MVGIYRLWVGCTPVQSCSTLEVVPFFPGPELLAEALFRWYVGGVLCDGFCLSHEIAGPSIIHCFACKGMDV